MYRPFVLLVSVATIAATPAYGAFVPPYGPVFFRGVFI
jgi:hypothetical protein